MPRKPFDARIIKLANEAHVKIGAVPSLDPLPADLGTPPDPTADNYPWPWADVVFTATYGGVTATHTDNGVSAADETDYKRSKRHSQALMRVLASLLGKLDTAAEALADLGV